MKKIITVVICVIVVFVFYAQGAKNEAFELEESINYAYADIKIQEKRRFDLVYNLLDCVEQCDKRADSTSELYKELMDELSETETLIAKCRSKCNYLVKEYTSYVRKFPTRVILDALDYYVIDYFYLNYDSMVYKDDYSIADAPQNLFGE